MKLNHSCYKCCWKTFWQPSVTNFRTIAKHENIRTTSNSSNLKMLVNKFLEFGAGQLSNRLYCAAINDNRSQRGKSQTPKSSKKYICIRWKQLTVHGLNTRSQLLVLNSLRKHRRLTSWHDFLIQSNTAWNVRVDWDNLHPRDHLLYL